MVGRLFTRLVAALVIEPRWSNIGYDAAALAVLCWIGAAGWDPAGFLLPFAVLFTLVDVGRVLARWRPQPAADWWEYRYRAGVPAWWVLSGDPPPDPIFCRPVRTPTTADLDRAARWLSIIYGAKIIVPGTVKLGDITTT